MRPLAPLLRSVYYFNDRLKRLSIKLVKWTGKSPEYIHPKHFLEDEPLYHWYAERIQPGSRVLDIGVGTGTHMFQAAAKAAFVAGLEYDIQKLPVVARRAAARGLENVAVLAADAERRFPFADEVFDTVIFIDVLEHLHNRDGAMDEARRVLKPGGVLALCVPNRETTWKRWLKSAGLFYYSDRDHKIEYTWDELEPVIARAGFRVLESRRAVFDFPLGGLLDVVGGFSIPLYRRLIRWKHALAERHPKEAVGFYVFCEKSARTASAEPAAAREAAHT